MIQIRRIDHVALAIPEDEAERAVSEGAPTA